MPVHLFGQCADMDAIMAHRQRPTAPGRRGRGAGDRLPLRRQDGGALRHVGCFTFFPTKNLGGLGDGGLVTTNDDDAGRAACVGCKAHGAKPKYYHQLVGYNSRLDTIHAAALSVKLPHLNAWSEARRKQRRPLRRAARDLPVELPVNRAYGYHIYNQYTIALDGATRSAST